jgi:TonB family protein
MKRLPIVVMALALCAISQGQGAFAQDPQPEGTRKVTARVVPPYPPLARNMNLKGTVKLEALVLANGKVKSVQVKGGNALLAQSAEGAVREWKWEKAEHETTELVLVNFSPN